MKVTDAEMLKLLEQAVDITITDQQYHVMITEIMMLPEKKRSKWHGTLTDKFGTRTKCIYKGGEIYNWCILKRTHRWARVVPMSHCLSNTIPMSPVGAAMRMGDDAFVKAFDAAKKEYATGNHYRNHHVKVPKQQDGSVRA